jgi:Zn-dependent M16 (insulinase) family peptidase
MHGFGLIYEADVPELSSLARLWRHVGSGAQLLSFMNKDENKVFGVTLRTPPHDSTGLPHILEHSVLCGSKKYPVKEPFVELLKGSLQTFLNAFTYPDKTCYPVASANLRDFYNLVDVYLDAVFHPRLNEWVLAQEGWHLEAVEAGGGEPEISFKGVVYNEMKGVFSSPEAVLERYAMHSLFPDSPYGLESGGDPERIPELTYGDFVDFHRRYYHPSNARFYFWGDDPEEKRLEILGGLLKGYARIEVADSAVPLQKPFGEERRARVPFAAGADDKAMFTLNWVLADIGPSGEQLELALGLAMLEHILLGMPASPLRRALLESGLGEDLAGGGLQDELKQMTFSIGLKGIEEQRAAAVEELILDTLEDLARNGVPAASVEAAINSVEFALRENNTGRFPVGLAVMLRSLAAWLHSDDPADSPEGRAAIAPLRFEAPLAAIKSKAGLGYFVGLIQTRLLDNRHRASVLLYPDQGLAGRREEEEAARVRAKLAALGAEERAGLAENTRKLIERQETPDSPEALAGIPRLEVADLPLTGQEIAQEKIPAALPL